MRHRSRAELPPSPIEFAYPLAIPDTTVLGAAILDETPGHFALHVFQALRLTFAWAAGPDVSGAEFDHANLAEWEADVLRTTGVDEALWAPVSVIASELARPAELEPARLSHACLAVVDWAVGEQAFGTAMLFAEAAAVVWPNNARLAWICGKIYRERQNLSLAGMWFRRAKRVAVWTGDVELQATALNSLGNLMSYYGSFDEGKMLLLSALRVAKRHGLRVRQAMIYHDLLLVSIYVSQWADAERYAEQAFAAYGPDHPNISWLTFDVSYLAVQQGQFVRALEILHQLNNHFTEHDRRLRVYAVIARGAGSAGDAEAFTQAWTSSWSLIDGGTVDHLRADAALELGLGAVSLGLREHAEHALVFARDAAQELSERDTFEKAQSALAKLEYREAAAVAARNRPVFSGGAVELATKYIAALDPVA